MRKFVCFLVVLMLSPIMMGKEGGCNPFDSDRRFGINTGSRSGQNLGGQGVLADPLNKDSFTNTATIATNNSVGLANGRRDHTATLLLDGRVLIVGGEAGGSAIGDAEFYDQGTGEFTASTAVLNSARMRHTASLLSNGNVVIAGGQDTQLNPLSSLEVYDPTLDSFTILLSTLSEGRFGHSAVSFPSDGRIFYMGGFKDSNPNPEATATADQFTPADPPGQKIDSVDDMPENRAHHGACLIPGPDQIFATADDRILITYGIGSVNNPSSGVAYVLRNTFQVFDPAQPSSQQWGVPTGITGQNRRWGHHAVQTENANADVIIVGGIGASTVANYTDIRCGNSDRDDGANPVGAIESYRPLETRTSPTASGQLTVGPNGIALSVDPTNPPFAGGSGMTATLHPNGQILIVGGTILSTNPCVRNRSAFGFLINPTDDPSTGATITQTGQNSTPVTGAPSSNQPAGNLNVALAFAAATLIPGPDGVRNTTDDTILVVGGQETGPTSVQNADVYTMP